MASFPGYETSFLVASFPGYEASFISSGLFLGYETSGLFLRNQLLAYVT